MDSRGEAEGRITGYLELRQGFDGAAYYLDGRRLEKGDAIEILLMDGQWLRGRYEWNGVLVVWPSLRVELAGPRNWQGGRQLTGAMPIPPAAILRRPKER